MQVLKSKWRLSILALAVISMFASCRKEENLKEQEPIKLREYLKDNGYENIEPTNSGLYHIVVEEGEGSLPINNDFVQILFTSTLVNGTVFETSDAELAKSLNMYRTDKLYGPTRFKLSELFILGLKEGLTLMNEGGKSRFIIPSKLGFGGLDYGIVPPYSTLIYDVELLNVIPDPIAFEQSLLDAYLEENEISVTPTGTPLVYVVTEEPGTGNTPSASQTVTMHFAGKLLDGRVFDSTLEEEPYVLAMNTQGILSGFMSGIRQMRKGGKAKIIIPWNSGYGSNGSQSGKIPPFTTLIFEIEIIDITD